MKKSILLSLMLMVAVLVLVACTKSTTSNHSNSFSTNTLSISAIKKHLEASGFEYVPDPDNQGQNYNQWYGNDTNKTSDYYFHKNLEISNKFQISVNNGSPEVAFCQAAKNLKITLFDGNSVEIKKGQCFLNK
ncbi:hypothetical protein ACFO26_01825 [Lactococcus nasutitermitis]|uniref:Lipoprotein n=1 Tax=Lactococcus nasutitermitis TaxID=1652957 RepID=A0ABV9JE32_9LACT|nr:hypothetical protein [Lactococcus nasutitermitis]